MPQEDVKFDVDAAVREVRDDLAPRIERATNVLGAAVAAAAPVGPTGNLRKSVRATFSEKTLTGTVKVTARHAHLIEYGWLHRSRSGTLTYVPARPFLRATFEALQPELDAIIGGR